jgi:hypothetical protein
MVDAGVGIEGSAVLVIVASLFVETTDHDACATIQSVRLAAAQ